MSCESPHSRCIGHLGLPAGADEGPERLVEDLRRQPFHVLGGNIRRIRDDEVERSARPGGKIPVPELHAPVQRQPSLVRLGDGKRICR